MNYRTMVINARLPLTPRKVRLTRKSPGASIVSGRRTTTCERESRPGTLRISSTTKDDVVLAVFELDRHG